MTDSHLSDPTRVLRLENLASESGIEAPFPARPFQVVSLLDMLKFDAGKFAQSAKQIFWLIDQVDQSIEKHHSGDITIDRIGHLFKLVPSELKDLEKLLKNYSFTRTHEAIESLKLIPGAPNYFPLNVVRDRLRTVWISIEKDFAEHLFLHVPLENSKKYALIAPFGQQVAEAFPSADQEVIKAGNCFALGVYDACVFHLMRAIEHGARAFGTKLNLQVGEGKAFDIPKQIKRCEWGILAIGFAKAISRLHRQEDHEDETVSYYNDILTHFSALKDVRNRISHLRGQPYDEYEAKSVFNNVEHFMKKVSERLSESKDIDSEIEQDDNPPLLK